MNANEENWLQMMLECTEPYRLQQTSFCLAAETQLCPQL